MNSESAQVKAELQRLTEKASNLGVNLEHEPWFATVGNVAKIGFLKREIKREINHRSQIEELRAEKINDRSEIEELRAETYEGSVEEMLAKFGNGIPDMPDRGLPPHQHSVPGANFTIRKNFVTQEDLNFQIRTKHGRKHIRSFLDYNHLDKNSQGQPVLSYQNEATVAAYVDGVVKMCLKTLGYFDDTRVFKEMTLFSLRPDLIVVEHKTRGIILVIEVKMPGQELFSSPRIAEHVVNYLMLQYRQGNTVPFVLLSSYREACLCCLKPSSLLGTGGNDDTEQMDVEEDQPDEPSEAARGVIGTAKDIVSEAARKLKSHSVDLSSSIGEEADGKNTKKPPVTPTKPGFGAPDKIPPSFTAAVPRKRKARNVNKNKPKITLNRKPEAIYSEKFTLNNMMQGVSLALTCGVLSQEHKTTKAPELWPEQGSLLDGWHPCVENKSYKWASVEHLTIDYEEQPLATKQNTEKYLLLRETGHGQNGRVSLAVDCEGRACALKFYLYSGEAEREFSPEKRAEMRKKELKMHKKAADREVQRWKTLQKQHAGIVIALELNEQHVVRMPLCCPVPEGSRHDVLGDVKTKLQEFYDQGFIYREVRWQHVGCRKTVDPSHSAHPWEIIMLDMESLVEKGSTPWNNLMLELVEKGVESQNVIEWQIRELRDHAGNAAASGPVGRLGL